MSTLNDIVTLAKAQMPPSRVLDEMILRQVIAGLLVAYRSRPDLFVGHFTSPPSLSMTGASTFPMDDAYAHTVADYAVARCETASEGDVKGSPRAAAFLKLFGAGING